ncbi:MAG: PAS domain-containing sensor histidine kinase [Bdellovibrionales bacterium]|nr:PAS domain-containing sensor histidine kinase [Oligoflexia bacterium]
MVHSLQNTLPRLLDDLAVELLPSRVGPSARPHLLSEDRNSALKQAFDAFPLSEVIHQYHLLRPLLLDTLENEGGNNAVSIAIIHSFIDEQVERAVSHFLEQKVVEKSVPSSDDENNLGELHGFFMQAPFPMVLIEGHDHRYLFANPAHDAFIGTTVQGKKVSDFCSPEDKRRFIPVLNKVYQEGKPWVGRELPWLGRGENETKKPRLIDVNFFPFRDSFGAIKGVLGFVEEVTDQVRTREKWREEEKRFRQLADGLSHQMVHVMELFPHRISYISPSFEKIMRMSPKDLENDPFAFLKRVHPADREKVVQSLRKLDEGQEVEIEYRLLFEDGSITWIRDLSTPLINKEGRAFRSTGIAEDITERKLFEHKLQESEAKFRTIANAMPQMVWSTLPDGYHDYYNQRYYEFTGVPAGSTHGEAWNEMFHPDDRQKAWKTWKHSVKTGEPYQIEYRLKHHSGKYRWTLSRALPVRDEAGTIIRWMGTCTDIQEMHETTQALANAVRARDDFLSIASHELKTPLTSLKLQTQLLQRDAKKGDKSVYTPKRVDRMLAQTEQQVQRLTRLIDDMLDISRIRSGNFSLERVSFDLCELVKETIDRLLPHFIATGYRAPEIETDLHCDGAWDKLRIEQVIINLITNSIRYGSGKPICVKVENKGELIRLSVRDHGIGIAKSDQKKIFNRFERAVDANEVSGLGLGLYIARKIVDAHGGRIWLESKLGLGSTFFVDLPVISP